LVAAVALRFVYPPAYYRLITAEDGPAEWLTVAAYLLALALALSIVTMLIKAAWRWQAGLYLVLVLAFLFVGMEEVSWGQRQLGFQGPERLVERNLQGEANVHNLLDRYALHGLYIAVGLYGAGLGRLLLRRLPALDKYQFLFVPAPRHALWFGTAAAVYVFHDYVEPILILLFGPVADSRENGFSEIQEIVELGLGCGFVLFLLDVRRQLRPLPTSAVGRQPSRHLLCSVRSRTVDPGRRR
jgi:hypothetical protein